MPACEAPLALIIVRITKERSFYSVVFESYTAVFLFGEVKAARGSHVLVSTGEEQKLKSIKCSGFFIKKPADHEIVAEL